MKTAVLKLTFLILAVSIAATAQTTDPTKQSEITFHNLDDKAVPLFVFTYFDPWRKIYGADMPEFALYQDGTVIFTKCRTKDHYSCFFRIAKLSADETAQLMNKLLPQAFN